jgi:phospholipase C
VSRLAAVSPWAKAGNVDHTYYDHASILKFIEKNWGLLPLSVRSRDNLPNPVQPQGGYEPSNSPAIGDLLNLFDFTHLRHNAPMYQARHHRSR